MTTVTTSNCTYIFVEVSKDGNNFLIENYPNNTCSLFYSINEVPNWSDIFQGNYTFLCTTDTITDEIVKGIVEYKHIDIESWVECFYLFMSNNNINTQDKTYAICKKS
jgi:hypothetical protein